MTGNVTTIIHDNINPAHFVDHAIQEFRVSLASYAYLAPILFKTFTTRINIDAKYYCILAKIITPHL